MERVLEKVRFSFEDLEVWHKAIDFAKQVINMVGEIDTKRKHYRLIEQLESSSTSIAMNIAEGKGRYSKKEYIQYLYIARGSLNETITLLAIFHKNNWINDKQLDDIKVSGDEIGKMISGLIASIKRSMT